MKGTLAFLLPYLLTAVAYEIKYQTQEVLNVDYQIHSNNDLKEFRQVLLKGSRKFKFDPHYVSQHTKCGKNKDCFLLNHDLPTTVFSDYNTSTELLNYLASKEFQTLTNNEHISIALCFKSAPDLCDSSSDSFKSWVSLVDDFYTQAISTVASNVEFILDGDAKPTECLVGKWLPWNSVWIRTGVTTTDCFTSNSTDGDCYRFQILNNPENVSNWEWMAQTDINYGKFSTSLYPYQLWEPDTQEDIVLYRDMYLAGSQHEAGYHFAINSDIAMFRVYSSGVEESEKLLNDGNSVPRGINQVLVKSTAAVVGENPILIPTSTNSYMSVFTSKEDHFTLYYVLIEVDADKTVITTSDPIKLPTEYSTALLLNDTNLLVAGIQRRIGDIFIGDDQAYILLVSSSGDMVSFSLSEYTDGSYYVGSLSTITHGNTIYDLELLSHDQCWDHDTSCVYSACVLVASGDKDAVYLTSMLIMGDHSNNAKKSLRFGFTPELVAEDKVVIPEGDTLVSFRLAVLDNDVSEIVVFTSNTDNKIKATLVERTVSSPKWYQSNVTVDHEGDWVQVSVGQNIDVSFANASGVLMLVNDFGYCYNSHDHNTRSYPTVCSAQPTPTTYTMDYSLGLIEDWKEVLSSTSSLSSKDDKEAPRDDVYAVTSCHANILHGTYDMGSKPSVSFLPSTNVSATPFFLTLHNGLPADSLKIALGGCGDAIPREGIVVDHFRIIEWIEALKQVEQH